MTYILTRLRIDAGQLTLGTLIQERALAAMEIERLQARVDELMRRKGLAQGACETQEIVPDDADPRHWRKARAAVLEKESPNPSLAPAALLRLKDVSRLFGVARTTIYKRVAEGTFPAPLRISERSVRWRMEELEKWASRLPYSR